jgi:ABC-type uncharacterized transport system substrate-binding protein
MYLKQENQPEARIFIIMKKIRLIVSILLFISFTSGAWAHPHVFVNNNVVCGFDAKGLTGVKIQWTFDELYSSGVIMDYDKNRDHALNPAESKQLAAQALADLKLNHYFTYIRVNGHDFPVKSIAEFNVVIKKGRVIYSFFVPCPIPVQTTEQTMDVSCYDESYYIEITTNYQNAATVVNKSGFHTNLTVTDDEEHPYYYEQVLPQKITLKFRR